MELQQGMTDRPSDYVKAAEALQHSAQCTLATDIAQITVRRVERDAIEDAGDRAAEHQAQERYHHRAAQIQMELREQLVQCAIVRRED